MREMKAKRVFEVLPDFHSIEKQYTLISGIDLLNQPDDQQFILQKTQDTDTQQILQYYKKENES